MLSHFEDAGVRFVRPHFLRQEFVAPRILAHREWPRRRGRKHAGLQVMREAFANPARPDAAGAGGYRNELRLRVMNSC